MYDFEGQFSIRQRTNHYRMGYLDELPWGCLIGVKEAVGMDR